MNLLLLFLVPVVCRSQPDWQKHIITEQPDGPIYVQICDMDEDGDLDLLNSAWFGDCITWNEQTGSNWVTHTVVSGLNGNRGCFAADLDGDGDMDVLGTSFLDDRVAWWEQSGGEWIEHVISDSFDGAVNVWAADMDNDGDLDVLGTAYMGGRIAWWENTGDDSWPENPVTDAFPGAYSVEPADFDLDGDLDIVCSSFSQNKVTIWKNTQVGWIRLELSNRMTSARCVDVGDIDNDGDPDIVAAAVEADEISWWENRQGTWHKRVITSNFNGARHVKLADMDQDGDLDLAASALWTHEIAWYEQAGSNWWKHVIDTYVHLAKGVDVADINNDGRLDIATCSYQDDQVLWFEQGTDTNPDPITIAFAPNPFPLSVAGGANFYFTTTIHFDIPQAADYQIWTELIRPDGAIVSPSLYRLMTIQPDQVLAGDNIAQWLPDTSAAGEYQYSICVGTSTSHAEQTASFDFTVLENGAAAASLPSQGDPLGVAAAENIPGWEVGRAFPNPFNAATTVTVRLPEAAPVEIGVFDTLGRQVRVLAGGTMNAGAHEISFDASALASGLYFIRTDISGHVQQVQKVLLVR